MSRRLNMYGFSVAKMRGLCGCRDQSAVQQLHDRIAKDRGYLPAEERNSIGEIVERAVMDGVPFRELDAENSRHSAAAQLLASHGQEWLITEASDYHDVALEGGLWGLCRKYAGPETKAFLHALIEGLPMFGVQPPTDGTAYAAVSLAKLRGFQRGLRDFADLIAYRVGRKRSPTIDDRAGVEFAAAFCGWVDQIAAAERDLWFVFG